MINRFWSTVLLLTLSNFFMNLAWYGHLKFKEKPLFVLILVSWGIAFFEYCLQVPANRIGSEVMSVSQLKILQEVLTLATFSVVAWFLFKEKPTVNQGISFLFLIGAVYFAFKK